jgi:GLPGLI family protein
MKTENKYGGNNMKRVLLLICVSLALSLDGISQTITMGYGLDPDISSKAMFVPPDGAEFINVDTTILVCTYDLKYVKNTASKQQSFDRLILELGENISLCYSSDLKKADSVVRWESKKEKRHARGGMANPAPPDANVFFTEVIKHYPQKGTMTVIDRGAGFIAKWEETVDEMSWELSEDTLTFLSHLCQKATCTFRGRDYTAWFTIDVPISNGPWKFGGLPGLILKVEDSKGEYIFECAGIENVNRPVGISSGLSNFKTMTRSKFLQSDKAFFRDPVSMLQSRERDNVKIRVMDIDTGRALSSGSIIIPYNPIELE